MNDQLSASFLKTLGQTKATNRSDVRQFMATYEQWIVDALQEHYAVSQIFRGLIAFGLHPPMSERHFYRSVNALKRDVSAKMASPLPSAQPRALTPALARPVATGPTPAMDHRSDARSLVHPHHPDQFKPKTFVLNPETDLDDIR
ncbi:hypothetical protein [uncultured Thiocystis sp.]|jgi:hypothetical protein|uniref:hypothetical protein n=1 Tax=uncultured Thiocystis sp. TaxID=1202134 RepID=UPI0025F7E3F4|nr:hypothetical protein [uncultured Thiocystis sp.]